MKPPVTVPEGTTPLAKPVVREEVSEAYFNHIENDAWTPCTLAIQESAKYGVRWKSVWSAGSRFSRWNKYRRGDGYLVLSGDAAEAQNGLGNWLSANYSCTFDPETQRVVDVTLEGGKLPRLR